MAPEPVEALVARAATADWFPQVQFKAQQDLEEMVELAVPDQAVVREEQAATAELYP